MQNKHCNGSNLRGYETSILHYPPILPIVYYEGIDKWAAGMQLRDRVLTEEGVEVSQGEEVQSQKWEDMYKAVSTKNSIIIYHSKINAWIFPRKDMGALAPRVIEMISTHMPAGKVKIRW